MKIIKIATTGMIAVGFLAMPSSSLAEIDSVQYTVKEERVPVQQNQLKNEFEAETTKEQTKQENAMQQEQPVAVQAAPSSFPDVPGWVKPSVDYLINKNVLSGMPDGTFSPNLEIDRGAAATMMAKILNIPVDQSAKPSFHDSQKHWAAPYIAAIEKVGVIKGEGAGKFNPTGKLTRGAMAAMLVNAYKLQEKVTENPPTVFKDLKEHWSEKHVNILVELGISSGYGDDNWKPDQTITRAEAVSLIAQTDTSKDKEFKRKQIHMQKPFFAYHGASLSSGIAFESAPQDVKVYEEREDGWVKIHTYQGFKWILLNEKKVHINRDFFTYDYPADGANVLVKYAAQTVTVVEERGTWLRIRTGAGLQWMNTNESRTVIDNLKTIQNNQQVILVTTNGYNTNQAQVRTFENSNGKWREQKNIRGYIGKKGFAVEMSESGMSSPRGKYTIGSAFGRQGNPGTKLPFINLTPNHVWVDDSTSPYYNTLQEKPVRGRWKSAENMYIPAYDYGFVINYNTESRTPYKGSAIFFHVSTSWTEGCTGVDKQNVIDILRWIDPGKNPVIIQTPENELMNY
ncbi:S-layer homology domain-containing protein [Bacillus luti]|uniref:S-layer homology domain-containing protein n=1 Tax=Bacillus luti TaxID=2026191 RepID=A0ABU8HPM2_9BACI